MGAKGERIWAIDWVRGIVMALMALDHVRDFWAGPGDPTDLANPDNTAAVFLTRWITHFCAPVFILLAGTSAWLYESQGRSRRELSLFLVTRGLWLIVLEFTVVYYAWLNTFAIPFGLFQVIAAIGVSMIALAGLIHLPRAVLVGVGVALVVGHNLLDPIVPEDLGAVSGLWVFLHEGGVSTFRLVPILGYPVLVIYPLLPWIGVMALGYAMGPWARLARVERRRHFLTVGLLVTAAFVLLRAWNGYGNPAPWSEQDTPVRTLLSFLNVTKYPPSLAFLTMTLGPSLVALALLDREPGGFGRACVTFGRVPLFFYVAHLFLAHGSARLYHLLLHGEPFSPMLGAFTQQVPAWYQPYPLWVVYAAWIGCVLVLLPICAGYGRLKRASSNPLFSYL